MTLRHGSTVVIVLLTALTSAASGCLKEDKAADKNAGTPELPVNATSAPAEVFSKTLQFSPDKNIPGEKFTIDGNWTSLKFSARARPTTMCYVLVGEPGGANPAVTFTSKNTTVKIPLQATTSAPSTCTLPVVASATLVPAPVKAEKVEWSVSIAGRGVNVNVELKVSAE